MSRKTWGRGQGRVKVAAPIKALSRPIVKDNPIFKDYLVFKRTLEGLADLGDGDCVV